MNITFLLSHLKKQGPTTQFLYLAAELNRLGCEVRVVIFRESHENDLSYLYKHFGIDILNVSCLRFDKKYKAIKTELQDSDIVCSYGLPADFLNFCVTRPKKRASFVRNQLFHSYWHTRGGLGIIYGLVNYIILTSFKHVFACSDAVKIYLDKYYMQSVVVRNSINSEVFQAMLETYALRGMRISGLNKHVRKYQSVFLTVASKLKGKNTEFLLEAFSDYQSDDRLLIVLGPVDDLLKKTYNSSNIYFVGYDPNIYEYLEISDYFISASLHEGLPNAVLEACYLGVPCILSDIPEHREIVCDKSYGRVGLTFKLNKCDLNDSLTRLSRCEYNQMSKSASRLVRNNFSITISAEKFLYSLRGGW